MILVDGNLTQGIGTDTGKIHGLRDTAMRGRRRVGSESTATGRNPRATYFGPNRGVSRHQQRNHVRHRRSRNKKARGGFRKAKQRARPVDDLLLDLYRRMVSPAEIRV